MRELTDEVYVFAVYGNTPGVIIESNIKGTDPVIGKNIFDYLDVSRSEREFFQNSCESTSLKTIATLCGKKNNKIVLFFTHFLKNSALGIAFVLDFKPEDVIAILNSSSIENIAISEALKEFENKDKAFCYENYKKIYIHIYEIVKDVAMLSNLKLKHGLETAENIKICAESAIDIAGACLKYDTYLGDEEDIYRIVDDVFDGKFCAITFLLISFAVRRCAEYKTLSLDVIRGLKSLRLKISFYSVSKRWISTVEYLKKIAVYDRGVEFNYTYNDKKIEIDIVPFYPDVAFLGVKGDESSFSLVDYEEYF